ncbi:Fe-S cluster assembly sulfur transfer protein SufU [Macrococcus sp. DPC7161]|uniref:Fe-S cluster assembly sulfur transfer protein SufU n=1 Tax=Macrococcus sp. DPC7161 TaxID=2507060 RepID=UPI00100AB49E|nr:SUF system NifU family Fe-S cluster assembly protein [Macrococcus sp. DPC7161]RXK18082.1 SUF system NifU family Fe-S cluster assembly protein [Macrococcus sp. DPC7161]
MSFNNLDQLYRSVIMDHYKNPRNKGVIEDGSMTIDMNNPTCGDRIRLTLDIVDDVVKNAKFEGEGCSISMSSASMMTEAIKGHTIEEALKMSDEFTKMMLGEDYEITEDMGDIEALSGVAKFPARIKCATLAWKAFERGTKSSDETTIEEVITDNE